MRSLDSKTLPVHIYSLLFMHGLRTHGGVSVLSEDSKEQ